MLHPDELNNDKKGKKLVSSRTKPVRSIEISYDIYSKLLKLLKRSFPGSGVQSGDRKTTLILVTLLATLTILLLVPFANKAFHIDDPMYLWAAKHILKSPPDFYNFNVNWYGIEEPMSSVMKNPPLIS